jgi:ADP-heptose:LPS heptosyltransferase
MLAQARAFVGNDSGVTHLAGALEVPTLALFGPTDPRIWAPPQRNVRVLQRDGIEAGVPQVRVADVCEQLLQLIR